MTASGEDDKHFAAPVLVGLGPVLIGHIINELILAQCPEGRRVSREVSGSSERPLPAAIDE
jgi:hypothetical protein